MPKGKVRRKRKAEIVKVAKTIRPSKNDSDELATKILDQAADLTWLELYPERKTFLDVINTECKDEFRILVSSLCNKYSDLLKSFRGKHAYVDLQIQWHEYIRAIAAFVEAQALQDAQIVASELDHSVGSSPAANAWLSIITMVNCHVIPTKADQFAMLHHFADCVYKNQHVKASEKPSASDTNEITEISGDENSIVALIRMCGSQLQRIYKNKQHEAQQLQLTCGSVPSDLRK